MSHQAKQSRARALSKQGNPKSLYSLCNAQLQIPPAINESIQGSHSSCLCKSLILMHNNSLASKRMRASSTDSSWKSNTTDLPEPGKHGPKSPSSKVPSVLMSGRGSSHAASHSKNPPQAQTGCQQQQKLFSSHKVLGPHSCLGLTRAERRPDKFPGTQNKERGSVVKPQFGAAQATCSDMFYRERWTSAQKKLVNHFSQRGQLTDVFLVESPTRPAETQEPV